MADPLFKLKSVAGVRRDGTELDSPYYSDVVWTRFQRGKPRKIGGYFQLSGQLNAPIRSVYIDGRNGQTTGHYFGKWGIQRQLLSGVSATGLIDRTPVGFVASDLLTWSHGVLYSSTGGSYAALLAASTPDVSDLTSDAGGSLYAGDVGGTAPLTVVSDGTGPISVSGGVCIMQPFAVVYGSNGLIRNSNANDYSTASGWTTGGANLASSANVAGTKFVYGAPVRGGGQTPAGLFWALDALVRMSYVGGTKLWQYDTLSQPTSILGKKTVVEHDGKFFWIGTDRFLFYNGTVQELPNQMNCNYFFEGLNYNQRNKVWGTKIARYGEIWWFYPRGTDTECNDAIIFNYNENTWYDARASRSAGHSVQIYPTPVWSGDEDYQDTTALPVGKVLATTAATAAGSPVLTFAGGTTGVAIGQVVSGDSGIPAAATVLGFTATTVTMTLNATSIIASATAITFSGMTTAFVAGQTVTGGTSGATGTAVRVTATQLNLTNVAGTFNAAETLTGGAGATAKTLGVSYSQRLTSVYRQETGWNKIVGQNEYSIEASFTTCNFGFAVSDPYGETDKGVDMMTSITRVEPDFGLVGTAKLNITGKSYASGDYALLESMDLGPSTKILNPRAQQRIMKVQLVSSDLNGFFELGETWTKLEPGDERGDAE